MLVAIIGFFVSWLQVYPYWSQKWGATFMLFFIIVFIASVVSMGTDSLDEEELRPLAVHEIRKHRR
jgi:hypothetical protein